MDGWIAGWMAGWLTTVDGLGWARATLLLAAATDRYAMATIANCIGPLQFVTALPLLPYLHSLSLSGYVLLPFLINEHVTQLLLLRAD